MKLNIIDKVLTKLTREEFETNMKSMMRWAKENNCYVTLRDYLDNEDAIFAKLKVNKYGCGCYTFGEALGLLAFIETKYKIYGQEDWNHRIYKHYKAWRSFYESRMYEWVSY